MQYPAGLFTALALAVCTASQAASPTQALAPDLQKAQIDPVAQFLLTAAATDFHTHRPPDPIRFRDVRFVHAVTPSGAEQYMLCGQFLPAQNGGKAEWTTFATIKTSGYEQYIGAQATAFCQGSSVVRDKEGDLSPSLQSRLDSLRYAPDAVVPVEEEPHHKTVFKNDYVQAFRVTLEPGKTSLMHTHAHDDAAVRLSTATVAADSPGQPLGPPEPVYPGLVSARDNEPKPHTHRVHNIGTTVFDVIDVQVLSRPSGPAVPAIAAPAAENAKMRLYRYELEPGAVSTQHTHARPYLLVAATDINLRMTSPDGASMEHPVKAGDMHWVDSAVTHTLGNRGTGKAILVEFELK